MPPGRRHSWLLHSDDGNVGAVAPAEYEEDWDWLVGGEGWDRPLQPVLVALAISGRASPLSQFFPFTSVNRPCFARGSTYPFEGEQPVFVSFTPDGSYSVLEGSRFDGDATLLLATADPNAAVAIACRRLGLSAATDG
jgi:hypothetical protein